jgi:hypothetical protein
LKHKKNPKMRDRCLYYRGQVLKKRLAAIKVCF